jgi:hypothetical protein
MSDKKNSPWQILSRDDVTRLVQFYDPQKNSHLNDLQTLGCHALWNTLCQEDLRFAYLADEVGMGKTYQALGVMGVLQYLKPGAKIVILCPGREMQKQWSSDWHSFFQEKYCPTGIDQSLKGIRIEANGVEGFESRFQPQICEDLREFAAHLVTSQNQVYLLRYSSFSVPLRVFDWEPFASNRGAKISFDKLVPQFKDFMDSIGCFVSNEELSSAKYGRDEDLSLDEATSCFLGLFIQKIACLIQSFSPDLIVWDEAQYLRTDANRNNSMRKLFGKDLYKQGCRHLFLSATPAHRDVSDMEKLNHVLENDPIRIAKDEEFRHSVSRWMVRRERSFSGRGKLEYRNYDLRPVDMFAPGNSPLYALSFATMQKKLVELLDGANNQFRMGEISSNESAKASIARYVKGKSEAESVLEESSSKNKQVKPIDEKYLEELGKSFKALQNIANSNPKGLPHAKVDQVVNELTSACLKNGSTIKELVFVRRIDTVDELADRLLHEFQDILNSRIEHLSRIHHLSGDVNTYWKLPSDQDDDFDIADVENQGETGSHPLGPVENLPYFQALSAKKGNLGRLTVYRNTLGKENSTISFLLAAEMSEDDKALWQSLLAALGIVETDAIYESFRKDSNKELLLRRCIGHSIRFTDILVDFDILRQRHRNDYVQKWIAQLAKPEDPLQDYFGNIRLKLRAWIEQFDIIVNKCFKDSGTKNSYAEIAERVAKYFAGLSPVARRSGCHKDTNVVPQFKFPIYPNILICTDVLREGVNLHLFCERVSHYGIAWNSGDLEQRIGRVERADSLFERQILSDGTHKLPVEFPYLARTLDERQVTKALNQKRRIDSLFKIIPPRETGECNDAKEREEKIPQSQRRPEPILPPDIGCISIGDSWIDINEGKLKHWREAMRNAHETAENFVPLSKEFRYIACRMIGEHGLIAIQWERLSNTKVSPPWNICDKMIFDTFERKKQWKIIRTLYFPLELELTNSVIQEFWESAEKAICGSSAQELHVGFDYCEKKHTHAKPHRIPHPFEESSTRHQDVHICRWGSYIVFTSDVGGIAELKTATKSPEQIISDINQNLPIGCATILDSQVLLAFPIIHASAWSEKAKQDIASRLAHWADRHQWTLLDGKDDELDHFPMQVSGVSDMNTSEAIDVLRLTKTWCENLNAAFDSALSEPADWMISSFNKIIENGTIQSVSKILKRAGEGKFQIGYTLSGLGDKSDLKIIRIYLSGKRANFRVVADDMDDVRNSIKGDYDKWLNSKGYSVVINTPLFHYAYARHRDGNQFRRVCITLPANAIEIHEKREEWVQLIVDQASKCLLNDQYQYNVAKERAERLS